MYDINSDGHISVDEFSLILTAFLNMKGSITLSTGRTVTSVNEICEEFFTGTEEISFEQFREVGLKNPDIMKGLSVL